MINRNPDPKQLRQFGYISLFAFPALGWFWGGSMLVISVLAAIGTLLAATTMMAPKLARPIFFTASLITAPIGMIVGEVMLAFVYYAVLCPIGITFRLIGRDSLQRTIDRKSETYWQPSESPKDLSRYYRQS